jgi:hypothetical protein
MKKMILVGWVLIVSGLGTTAALFSTATGAQGLTSEVAIVGGSAGWTDASMSSTEPVMSVSSGGTAFLVGPDFGQARSSRTSGASLEEAAPLGDLTLVARPTPAVTLEFWMAGSLAAIAGAFGAFWVSQLVMEGLPEQLPDALGSREISHDHGN